MKLLLDENLSSRLVESLAEIYPGSQHVHSVGLGAVDDTVIWNYAKEHGFSIVTKDSDFPDRCILMGHPPKVIWLRLGNCRNAEVEALLMAGQSRVRAFLEESDEACLWLGRTMTIARRKAADR
ncbi:MAG: DUF5615 family PIN-like protein [Acidobacteriota bacterium]